MTSATCYRISRGRGRTGHATCISICRGHGRAGHVTCFCICIGRGRGLTGLTTCLCIQTCMQRSPPFGKGHARCCFHGVSRLIALVHACRGCWHAFRLHATCTILILSPQASPGSSPSASEPPRGSDANSPHDEHSSRQRPLLQVLPLLSFSRHVSVTSCRSPVRLPDGVIGPIALDHVWQRLRTISGFATCPKRLQGRAPMRTLSPRFGNSALALGFRLGTFLLNSSK